jgi:hypothetical protein
MVVVKDPGGYQTRDDIQPPDDATGGSGGNGCVTITY